jgi:hypothetical protein
MSVVVSYTSEKFGTTKWLMHEIQIYTQISVLWKTDMRLDLS